MESPVTVWAEQVTAYVAASENANDKISNNVNSTTNLNGQLSTDILKLCKETEKNIVEKLEPDGLAGTVLGKSILNLTGAIKSGKIKVARLKMNRKPKDKAIKALSEDLIQVGQQIMLLIISAEAAQKLGLEVEGFNGEDIPEKELEATVVIIDGQTRMQGYLKAVKDSPKIEIPDLYAYFPLNWIPVDQMLKSINLKVFTWKNSDFMTGIICDKKTDEKAKEVFEAVQRLEKENYNFTAACEWITLNKGIIRKSDLLKYMGPKTSTIDLTKAEFGLSIHEVAKNKFHGDNEVILKKKTLPELVISRWNEICKDISQKEATEYMKKFIEGLTDEEVKEMAQPCEYKRGCGKKKEYFLTERFEASFRKFQSSHSYSEFKIV